MPVKRKIGLHHSYVVVLLILSSWLMQHTFLTTAPQRPHFVLFRAQNASCKLIRSEGMTSEHVEHRWSDRVDCVDATRIDDEDGDDDSWKGRMLRNGCTTNSNITYILNEHLDVDTCLGTVICEYTNEINAVASIVWRRKVHQSMLNIRSYG